MKPTTAEIVAVLRNEAKFYYDVADNLALHDVADALRRAAKRLEAASRLERGDVLPWLREHTKCSTGVSGRPIVTHHAGHWHLAEEPCAVCAALASIPEPSAAPDPGRRYRCSSCGAELAAGLVDTLGGHARSEPDENGDETAVHCGPCYPVEPDPGRPMDVIRDGAGNEYPYTPPAPSAPPEEPGGWHYDFKWLQSVQARIDAVEANDHVELETIEAVLLAVGFEPMDWERLNVQDSEIDTLRESLRQAREERDKMFAQTQATYCAYCGWTVRLDDPENVSKIEKHIATCPKHPVRRVEARCTRLTEALRGMVSATHDTSLADEPVYKEARAALAEEAT